ncbi:MAG TPA: hypothetical protein VJB39_00715 [Patescibacteria group bacterium]|nr:hypothetical protein [Patescibacteria group bacterium]
MDKIAKLLRKISKKDRFKLLHLLELLVSGNLKNPQVSKITNTDFFRLRSGNYRIIFHHQEKKIIIDGIKLRNKDTYKGL